MSNIYAAELESVRMQLRWHHQYQFAGYYAAKHKGFYKDAGFDVEIIAGDPYTQPVNEILTGRADFAEGNSEVLINQLQGKPLVALAAMFQHSPSILLTLADSGITKAEQLKNKQVMLAGNNDDVDLIAMFRAAGISEQQVNIHKSTYNLNDLIIGNTAAFNSYSTNEPYYLEEKGIKYNIISPQDYGVDFYSDILFTTADRVKKDPEAVQRFKEASIKGWQYAINHSEEIIQVIFDEYSQKKSQNHMRFEALTVNSLVKSKLLPIGHMFPKRLEKMADVFIEQNMIIDKDRLEKFIFVPPTPISNKAYTWLISAGFITFLSIAVLVLILKMNWQLKKEIKQRKRAEEKLQILADTDGLTNLLNRRAFIKQYHNQEAMAMRYKQPFSLVLLDLDLFKNINDTHGHDVGDKVLIEATNILTTTLRDVDICARFGGEEFIALLPNTTKEQARKTIERVRENFENTVIKVNDKEIKFTASFGIIQWRHEELSKLLIQVDKALYLAKNNGRNKVEVG
ncbi:MAG: ABC transporter substrate-binding protein [Thalassotalea sp.]